MGRTEHSFAVLFCKLMENLLFSLLFIPFSDSLDSIEKLLEKKPTHHFLIVVALNFFFRKKRCNHSRGNGLIC